MVDKIFEEVGLILANPVEAAELEKVDNKTAWLVGFVLESAGCVVNVLTDPPVIPDTGTGVPESGLPLM